MATLRIGLISDTHGWLRPEAKAFLSGCDYIVHGGDITTPDILEELARLAPIEKRADVLFVNPGSAGPRRFKLPVTVAELIVDRNVVSARIVQLETQNGI